MTTHTDDCTGCPHCDPEMAAIRRDTPAGWARRLTERTISTLRALGAKTTHNAYRATGNGVPTPPSMTDAVIDPLAQARRVVEQDLATQRQPRPVAPGATGAPSVPNMTDAIKRHQRGE